MMMMMMMIHIMMIVTAVEVSFAADFKQRSTTVLVVAAAGTFRHGGWNKTKSRCSAWFLGKRMHIQSISELSNREVRLPQWGWATSMINKQRYWVSEESINRCRTEHQVGRELSISSNHNRDICFATQWHVSHISIHFLGLSSFSFWGKNKQRYWVSEESTNSGLCASHPQLQGQQTLWQQQQPINNFFTWFGAARHCPQASSSRTDCRA